MPELPEVETVKNILKKYLMGRTIIETKVLLNKIIVNMSPDEFSCKLKNQQIENINRRGKWLILELNNYDLIVHFRMEGRFLIRESNEILTNHDLVIFSLDNGKKLCYYDTRRFGKIYLKDKGDQSLFIDLGVEPLSDNLTVEYLKTKLSRNKRIKSLLLDQSIVSGIGNIYADEILFYAKINPNIKGINLRKKDYVILREGIISVIKKEIKLKSTNERSLETLNGEYGSYKDELQVHHREGELCFNCQKLIVKTKVGGRGTYYCPNCQKRRC